MIERLYGYGDVVQDYRL